jgi:hypothetical protein
LRIGVDPHMTEVGTEARLEIGANRCVERPAR